MNISASIEKAIAGRWIAGYYPKDALDRAAFLNSKKIGAIVNYLGEEVRDRRKVAEAVETYLHMISVFRKRRMRAALSIKPTQIGMRINRRLMRSNYSRIVKEAKRSGIFIWLDMESSDTVDGTISLYMDCIRQGNTGICIQAYLRRSMADSIELVRHGATIRLVKGAYSTRPELRYSSRHGTDMNYMRIMRMLFEKSRRFMIATHDSRLINEAIRENKHARKKVSFAMLNGIRNAYAMHLARSGLDMNLYVPFGADWVGYGIRRLTEQRHLSLIVRSMFETQ